MEAKKQEVIEHAPGSFCWVELGTSDAAASKKFYSAIFGWTMEDEQVAPDCVYTKLQIGGKDVGALYQLNEEMKAQGIPPNWGLYVAVTNVDETAKQVTALGGKVVMEPFDVMDVGRMAILQDPTGATLSLWQARKHIGSQVVNQPGTLCWSELATTNAETAGAFLSKLFGWSLKAGDVAGFTYTEFINQGTPIGGMMQMTAEWGGVPPYWMPYFAVEDCDAVTEKAKSAGASIKVPPTDIPNTGRFSVIQDPQGAGFAIIKLTHHA